MKILWVKTDFLHPTTRGGQIRTLEILRRLHARHEIHYVAYQDPAFPEGLARAGEYSTRAYPVTHRVPERGSVAFAGQMAMNLGSSLPLPVSRYVSAKMREQIQATLQSARPDRVVCDFLFPAPNLADVSRAVVFQHNVEAVIWERHADQASDPLRRAYFRMLARRMSDFEGKTCRDAGRVIAVSTIDADRMRQVYGATRVSVIPTGVDLDYFAPPEHSEPRADLVMVGSMDWMPNVDGVEFFLEHVLPRISQRRPKTTFAVVGRAPSAALRARAEGSSGVTITGTVPDVRPWLWGAKVSVVPLRIGGGTRLKIYEAMAACVPVVSTTIGAEGLSIDPPRNIRIADQANEIADACLELLESEAERKRVADAARQMVAQSFSWEHVAGCFEDILAASPGP